MRAAWTKPNHKQKGHIQKILYGRSSYKTYARCPARSFSKLREYELDGDFSHSGRLHICVDCQCDRIAGDGTEGEFWGMGDEWCKIGHWGVGYCREHENAFKHYNMNTWEFAEKHKEALMEAGMVKKRDPELMVKHEAKVAKRNLILLNNMETLQRETGKFIEFLRGSGKRDLSEVESGLAVMTERIKDFDWNEKKDRDRFLGRLNELVMNATELTESSGGRTIPMTDKTKIDCLRNLVKDVSKLNLDEYRMGKDAYVKVDEIKVRIPKMVNATKLVFQKVHELYLNYDQDGADRTLKEELDLLYDLWLNKNVEIWDTLN